MIIAAATVPICALRKEPTHHSEMTSQLLFGELAEVMETNNKFSNIRCLHDHYEGWVYTNQLTIVDEIATENPPLRCADWSSSIQFNNSKMTIPFGSSLQLFQSDKATFGAYQASFDGTIWDPVTAIKNETTIRELIEKYLGTSYLWGGRSVFGIDCSGFVQMVYQFLNIALQRDAAHQAKQGEVIGFLQEARCGDLAFFDNEAGKIVHVGILLNSHQIAHAAEKVRVDKIDSQGIVHSDSGVRTHQLRLLKRIIV